MAAVVQSKGGAQNTGLATVTASWDTPATAGNLLMVIVGSDDYRPPGGIPAGFTESTGCKQETNLGHYVWWKVAAGGETSTTYTIGSASTSVWATIEVSGLDTAPYDISAGQFTASGASSYTTPTITPSAGDRFLVASMGGSTSAANFTGLSAWLNGFIEIVDTTNTKASGTRDIIGAATLSVTADGATGYSSGASYSPNATARVGIIIAFKVAAGGGSSIAPTSIAVPVALGSPTSDWSGSAAPGGIAAPVAVGAPDVTWSGSVAPDGQAVAVALGAPIVGAASVNPGGLSVPVAVGGPALGWSGTVTPDGLSVAVALGSPVVGSAPVAPDGLPVPVSLGAVSLSWSAAVAPDGIGVPVAAGAVSVSMPGTVVRRPFAGTVVRPSAGAVVRPDTGVVSRP